MIKELILYSPERWKMWIDLVGFVIRKVYPASSGSSDEGYTELRRVVSVALSDYEGYIEIIYDPL